MKKAKKLISDASISSVLVGILAIGSIVPIGPISPKQALAQTTVATTSVMPLCEITRDLNVGDVGEDVRCLQRYLNFSGFLVASSGPGSPGNESIYYGPLTSQAVARWQNQHASLVLLPLGLPAGTGYWGRSSFNHYVTLVRQALL